MPRPSEEEVAKLAAEWEPSDELYFGICNRWAETLEKYNEELDRAFDCQRKEIMKYHGRFAAELTAEIIACEALEINPSSREDEIQGLMVRIWHKEGVFGVPAEGFEQSTQQSLTDLIETWLEDDEPEYRKKAADYLRRLADELEAEVRTVDPPAAPVGPVNVELVSIEKIQS